MTKTKALYGFLCALAVVLGLFPSFYLNVRPWWGHDRGLAIVQLIFTLIAAGIPLFIFRLHWGERIFFGLLLLVALRVSVANGIESITLTRGEIVFAREGHINVNSAWTTHIEEWIEERDTLKKRYVPIAGEREYVPTNQASVEAKRDGRDIANKERDIACKVSHVSTECKELTRQAETAQTKLEQAIQNYELTQRVDRLEHDIREAKDKLRESGAATPDYLGKARDALEGAWFNPLVNREMWTAYMAEGAAAGAPKLFVYIVSLLFAAALGENWWRESTKKVESTQAYSEFKPIPMKRKPPKKPTASTGQPWGAEWLDGVKAWIDAVRPVPGGSFKRYTPGMAFSHYVDFCQARGYPPCSKPVVLGRIISNHIDIMPVAKTGGQGWYELNLGPKLALVKVGAEA